MTENNFKATIINMLKCIIKHTVKKKQKIFARDIKSQPKKLKTDKLNNTISKIIN